MPIVCNATAEVVVDRNDAFINVSQGYHPTVGMLDYGDETLLSLGHHDGGATWHIPNMQFTMNFT
jgi:hypothetical protein